jgi:cytosine/adenosine deaminase-related metal-dependent hydrolase
VSRTVYSADWVLPVDGDPVADGAVAVEDGRIAAVGPAEELGEGERFAEAVIVPGFVNAHSHLEYAVYAGFGDGLAFGPWLNLHIARKQGLVTGDDLAIARLGAAECLRSGITTLGDSSFSGVAAQACADLGLRAIVFLEVFGHDVDQALAEFCEIRDGVGNAFDERVQLGVGPHAPYSVSSEVYAACRKLDLPLTTHLSEISGELDWLIRGTGEMASFASRGWLVEPPGMSSVRHLAESGVLDSRMIAAHCVKVDAEEIALLAEHDVGVAHCPRSNALLGCGIAPLADLRAAGLRIGLGTDSPASTPSFDMFEEMRVAVYAARARERRPDALLAGEALELATLGGAGALGLGDEVGSLAPGKRADLAVVSLAGSPYLPWEDPAVAVVFGGSPDRVLLTLVAGEVRYEKGGFEWRNLRRSAASARARLLSEAPVAPKT